MSNGRRLTPAEIAALAGKYKPPAKVRPIVPKYFERDEKPAPKFRTKPARQRW